VTVVIRIKRHAGLVPASTVPTASSMSFEFQAALLSGLRHKVGVTVEG